MKSYLKPAIVIFFLLTVILGTANFALAQSDLDLGLEAGEQIGLSGASPATIIVNVVRVLLGFLALVAVILIMYGGFIWMTAGGNAEKIEKAKKILRNAAIGLLIILSAFAIVSFLMTKLIPPTPCVGPDCPGNCEPPCAYGLTCCPGDYCAESCGTPPPDGSFLINRTIPGNDDANVIRNIVIRAYFNKQIDNSTSQTALENNFKVEDLGQVAKNGELIAKNYPPKIIAMEAEAASDISGTIATSSAWQEINFRPLAECGDEDDTPNCLPGSRRIQVTINGASGIFSIGRQSLSCAGTSCRFIFTTGELIDTEAPTSGIIPAQMCRDDGTLKPDANTVGGWGRDDIAIAKLEFYSQKSGGPENLSHLEPGIGQKYQYLDWKYDTAAMNIGDNYTFKVRAEDLAASSSVASFETSIKPGHCCNGKKDADEEDVDCGGDDCLACVGQVCNVPKTPNQCAYNDKNNCQDNLCASWFCPCATDDCLCNVKPIIKAVTPEGGFCNGDINRFCRSNADCIGSGDGTCNTTTPNGAIGNFITIHGNNFGALIPGSVYFSGGSGGWIKAKLANDGTNGNPLCGSDVWKDTQVVVIVPAGARPGPIKIEASGKEEYPDLTNDAYGPNLDDFLVNTISRPGICKLDPDHGIMNGQIGYYGIKMDAGSAFFGNLISNVAGLESQFNEKIGNVKVPNISPGLTSSFVIKSNVNSNFLDFTKDQEPYLGPLIESFDPQTGTSTQYVTILGRGFGNSRGESRVFFGNENGKEAGYNFPKVCASSVWTDNQVIVKVPDQIADGLYLLTMKIGTVVINTSELATPKFRVDSSEPLKPSLCKIQPVMGPVGQPVSFWGEYFGEKDANSKIKFYLNKYQSGSSIGFWGTEDAPDGIDPDIATTTVPAGAISGPVRIVKNTPELAGNGLNFRVGECSESAECGSEAVCCPSGSERQGRCMEGDSIEEACYDVFRSCVYEWDFSTGAKVGDPCDKDKDKAKCQPDQNVCGNDLICYVDEENPELDCTCQLSCDLKPGDDPVENQGCQADDNKCKDELGEDYVCDPNKGCTCQPTYTESCSGYDIEQCAYNYCSGPKKPGQCSVNVKPKEGNKCNNKYCKDLCGGKSCEYNESLDKCADKTAICGLSHEDTIHGTDGKDYPVNEYCAAYNGKSRWQVKNFENCNLLGNSWRNAGNSICADISSECGGVCEVGLSCVGENGKDNNGDETPDEPWTGICGVDRSVCGSDYECRNGTCQQKVEGSCECCCQKSENKFDPAGNFKYNPQCCAPLKCGSECGESVGKPDKVCKKSDGTLTKKKCDTDPDCDSAVGETCVENLLAKDFGLCSACRIDSDNNGEISPEEQNKSDEACNCPGSTGKYCDAETDANADGKLDSQDGVCRECGELSYYPAECTEHDASCCVDGKVGNVCRGITPGGGTVKVDSGKEKLSYCGYYKCGTSIDQYQCDSDNPSAALIDPDNYPYDKPNCNGECGSPPGGSCYNKKKELCSLNCWMENVYKCFGESGCEDMNTDPDLPPACNAGDGSCLCCCDPSKTGTDSSDLKNYDACQELDNKKLKCEPDKEPCTSEKRGLCCGCEADTDCIRPDENVADLVGCGFDACCRARPEVEDGSEMPKNGQKDACRNARISAKFTERMDIQSFPSSIIVAGEYNGKCPDGTVYLAFGGEEPGFFKRMIARISGLVKKILHFNSKEAIALAPASDKNYCAVKGSVSGYQTAGKKTEIIFSVSKLLDPGRQYYVIIKGDEKLDSQSGVFSFWKIGMNGKGYNDPFDDLDDGWNELESVTFNGKTYTNSHVWTFKTMDSKSENEGVCTVKDVTIDPDSYLYKTNIDDLAENDADPADRTFDTAYDIDKVFLSKALSKDGQVLVPVKGYSWNWNWLIDNPRVANISSAPDHIFSNSTPESDRQLIRANDKITDGETFAKAAVNFDDKNTVGQKSGSVSGKANIWVFICDNPWPAIKNGLWAPWIDKGAEEFCNAGKTGAGASCQNTNYELYYCRDSGAEGTADDLPVINADSIFRRDPDTKILKEVYYLRGQLPAGGYDLFGLSGTTDSAGEKVALHWSRQAYVGGYKVYYGINSGDYIFNKTLDAIESGDPADKQVICTAAGCDYVVSALTNGQTYYFAVTSYSKETSAESAYSSEISAKAEDKVGPGNVKDSEIKTTLSSNQVKLEYTLATDAVSSEVFYKAVADKDSCNGAIVFGGSVKSTQKDGKGTATVKSLTNGSRYCFGVVAYDSSINPSATTTLTAVPFSNLSNLKAESAETGKARLSWGAAKGIAEYDVYQKKDGDADYARVREDLPSDYTYYNLDSLENEKKYYFKVSPKNIDGVDSAYLNEVNIVIK